MATPLQVTLEDRIHIAELADLAALDAEIANLNLDVTTPFGFHTWMLLGREMNKRHWLASGRGAERYYAGVNAGLWPDVGDLPVAGGGSFLLREDGGNYLREDGGNIEREV